MTVIALYNIKGGVGKTASAVNFSFLAAEEGFKTLLCDFDPQAAASFYFNKTTKKKADTQKMIEGSSNITTLIRKTDYDNLHILPSDISYRNMDLLLDDVNKSKKRVKELLKELKNDYDVIFIDSPPNISLVSENIFNAADYLLIPTIPTVLSLRTYTELLDFLKNHDKKHGELIPFFSMVESRKRLHKDSMEQFRLEIKNTCRNKIPSLSDIERMGITQKPVTSYRKSSRAAKAYAELWQEIKLKVKLED